MKILRLFILTLCFNFLSEAIIFENTKFNDTNFQKANTNVSLELKTIAETLKVITEETMKVYGEVAKPYSNVENEVIINVLLYDVIDKEEEISSKTAGYFSFFDQLKESGTGVDKVINGVSNFGNVIYLDLNPFDPTVKLPSSSSDLTLEKLYANRNAFYSAYASSLARLIHFQKMNQGIKDYEIANRQINFDYNWLETALARFNSFRAMKNLSIDKFGVEPGVKIRVTTATDVGGLLSFQINDGDTLFDTTGAVSNPNDYTSIEKNIAPVSLLHYLKNKPKDLPFPHLFYEDQVPTKYRTNKILTNKNYQELAANLNTFLFIYIWEQLQDIGVDDGDTTRLMGDRFIQAVTNLKNTFEILPGVQSSFYQTATVNPDPLQISTRKNCTETGYPVDKICQINKTLYQLLMTEASPADRPDSFNAFINASPTKVKKNRSFQDYFDDLGLAMYMDKPANDRTDPLQRYELRNFDLAKIDNIYANLSKQDVFRFNIGQRAGVDHRCEINSANIVDCTPTDLIGLASALSTRSTSASLSASEELFVTLFGNDLEPSGATVNPYSLDYYKLLNSASTADIVFGVDDIQQIADSSTKRSFIRTMVKTKFVGTDSKMNFGITTYVVNKSVSSTDQTSSRILYASGIERGQIKFQRPKASFLNNASLGRVASRSKIDPIQFKGSNFATEIEQPQENIHASIMKNYSISKSVSAVSGVTQWDRYKTVNEVRTNPTIYNVDTGFRNYTSVFKTIDFSQSDESKVIYNKNTALLKEKITGTFKNLRYKILLWVDQQNLSKGDTEVPQPEDTSGSSIEEDPNPTNQVTKAIDVGGLDFNSNNQTGESVTISSLSNLDNPYILKITNNTDEEISVKFSLNDSNKASEKFLLTNPSASKSKVAQNWKTLIVTKKSIQYSTFTQDAMDVKYSIAPRSIRSFGIANKSNSNESLLYVLQKVQASTGQVDGNSVSAVESSGGGGGGCFIATAAYGSLYHPIVKDLVLFRDQILLNSRYGSKFVELYYTYSPQVADFIAESQILRWLTSIALLPLWMFSVLSVYSLSFSILLLCLAGITCLVWLFRLKLR